MPLLKTLTLLFLTCGPLSAAEPPASYLSPKPAKVLETEYFDVSVKEYAKTPAFAPSGGALLVTHDRLLVGESDGTFCLVNPHSWRSTENYLPRLDMGPSADCSLLYLVRECPARVHGLAYAQQHYYVAYDRYVQSEDRYHFVLSRIKQGEAAWKDVYVSPPITVPYFSLSSGGKLAVDQSQDRIYVTVGDYSTDRVLHLPDDIAAQNPALPFGKVMYLDLKDDSMHVYSMGHRNSQGLALLNDGRLMASEHGPRGGDELDIIKANGNYGWPYQSYGTYYGQYARYNVRLRTPPGLVIEKPIYVFLTPAIAPTQLAQVDGFDPNWNGDLLLGSLRAETLFHIKLVQNHVFYVEPLPLGHRIRDLVQYEDSFILLTDEGTLLRITKNAGLPKPEKPLPNSPHGPCR
ncbi:MAG TPA: PQQ-dependent sugar dehydrogenase [bacterium]|nr:PQQ-dependent sugar dehydrogenase [bacterium]